MQTSSKPFDFFIAVYDLFMPFLCLGRAWNNLLVLQGRYWKDWQAKKEAEMWAIWHKDKILLFRSDPTSLETGKM